MYTAPVHLINRREKEKNLRGRLPEKLDVMPGMPRHSLMDTALNDSFRDRHMLIYRSDVLMLN